METTHQGHPYFPFLQLKTSASIAIEEWCTSSIYGLTSAMMAAVIASVTYECLDEYLKYIRHQAMTSRTSSSGCCGQPMFTCGQKIAQTVILMIRVLIGYFMMLCVMTWNVWLLAAVTVGAAVGYGAFKPLVANSIADAVVTHGYDVASVSVIRRTGNRSQRSTSWRYRTVSQEPYVDVTLNDDEPVFHERANTTNVGQMTTSRTSNEDSGTDVWILRSDTNNSLKSENSPHVSNQQPETSNSLNNSDVVLRHPDTSPASATSATSSPPSSRFKSTSKVISKQFRSLDRSESVLTSRTSISSIVVTPSLKRASDGRRNQAHRSASTSSGRFKSVSRQISRHQSFNCDKIHFDS